MLNTQGTGPATWLAYVAPVLGYRGNHECEFGRQQMIGGEAARNMPEAEVDINEQLVRRILEAAARSQGLDPKIAAQSLELVANGWDNVMFRLGVDHLVRLPRRQVAVPLIENEQRWLRPLADRLPLAIPVPTFAGRPVDLPDVHYPWPWSIVPWFDGEPLAVRTLPAAESESLANDLARFLHALHTPCPSDGPANPFRGGPLSVRVERTTDDLAPDSPAMQVLGSDELRDRVRDHWTTAVDATQWDRGPRWLHGDLHALNLVWHDGRMAAVIDFGDITGGDPATDLGVAWSLFPDPAGRARFQKLARIDDQPIDADTWSRARGWALSVAAVIVNRSADNPVLFEMGCRTLLTVAEDEGGSREP